MFRAMFRMTTLAAAFCLSLLGSASFSSNVQASSPQEGLTGYVGNVAVYPNPQRKEVTVVLTTPQKVDAYSHQIVFHVQSSQSRMPPAYAGAGRVLVNASALAVIPANGSAAWMYKFPEIAAPASIQGMGLSMFSSYGIARYDGTALTQGQIDSLVATGRFSRSPASLLAGFFAGAPPKNTAACSAGGPGASSAGPGENGSAVTCTAQSYACCDAKTGKCRCVSQSTNR